MILSNLEVLSLSVHHKHRCPKNPKISHFASGGGKVGLSGTYCRLWGHRKESKENGIVAVITVTQITAWVMVLTYTIASAKKDVLV